MKSQLFKNLIPTSILFEFLKEYSHDKGSYYLFSNISYNKAKYHNGVEKFCDKIKDYYFPAKQHYATRKMTYNNFTTILRQICKTNLVTHTSKVKYEKSSYDIEYFIYK